MAYKYSEERKPILTPELVIHDMKGDDRFNKAVAPFMLILPPIGALLATLFMNLVTGGDPHRQAAAGHHFLQRAAALKRTRLR